MKGKYNTLFTDSMKTDNVKSHGKCKHDQLFSDPTHLIVGHSNAGPIYKKVDRCKLCGTLLTKGMQ